MPGDKGKQRAVGEGVGVGPGDVGGSGPGGSRPPEWDPMRQSTYDAYGASSSFERRGEAMKKNVTYFNITVGNDRTVAMSPREQKEPISVEKEDEQLRKWGLSLERYDYPTFDYNCHGWTLLNGKAWLDNINGKPLKINVIDRILREVGCRRVDPAERRETDLAFYHDNTGFVPHSGCVDKDTSYIVSKWDDGSLFKHKVDEVPRRYQGQVKYYRPPDGWKGLPVISAYELPCR